MLCMPEVILVFPRTQMCNYKSSKGFYSEKGNVSIITVCCRAAQVVKLHDLVQI